MKLFIAFMDVSVGDFRMDFNDGGSRKLGSTIGRTDFKWANSGQDKIRWSGVAGTGEQVHMGDGARLNLDRCELVKVWLIRSLFMQMISFLDKSGKESNHGTAGFGLMLCR